MLVKTKNVNEPGFIVLSFLWIFSSMLTIGVAGLSLKWTGEKVVVDAPEAVLAYPYVEYYEIKEFKVAKADSAISHNIHASGRSNDKLNFDLYIASPLYSKEKKSSSVNVWLGTFSTKNVSNRSSDKLKQSVFDQFLERAISLFNDRDHSTVRYFERIQPGTDLSHFTDAINKSNRQSASNYVVLKPVFEPFEDRLAGVEVVFIGVSGAVLLLSLSMLLFVRVDSEKVNEYEKKAATGVGDQLQHFKRQLALKGVGASISLVATLFVAYLITMGVGGDIFSVSNEVLLKLGANYGPRTVGGEWWRLFTSVWLHNGLAHLAFNGIALFVLGSVLEPIIGSYRLLISFVLTGIVASGISLLWNENVLSVGASGAIYGLFGVLFALLSTRLFPRDVRMQLFKTFALYCGVGLFIGVSGIVSSIDNAAHFGGLISGYAVGLFVYLLSLKKPRAN